MIPTALLACGNCIYYAMWHKFPPISSWAVILPIWFITLSAIRTTSATKVTAIPELIIAVPLVFAVFLFAPGMLGPLLGAWIPVCCIIGTCAALTQNHPAALKRKILATTALTAVALSAFGAYDYHHYNQMPAAEKDKYLPAWEAHKRRKQNEPPPKTDSRTETPNETTPPIPPNSPQTTTQDQ